MTNKLKSSFFLQKFKLFFSENEMRQNPNVNKINMNRCLK